jgi:aminoacylase
MFITLSGFNYNILATCESEVDRWEKNDEIKIFREYLRIPSVQPDVDYVPCVNFLKKLAGEIGLNFQVEYPSSRDRPTVVISWIGKNPNLKTIMLNSHMDVVPVFEEFWTHKPFAADIDSAGKIFARGSQDMKNVGMQYLGAIRSLKNHNITLKRTIHVIFVPDEENFGPDGMRALITTDNFKNLNVGFTLDEGYASQTDVFSVFYGQRTAWHVLFKVEGHPGHGSLLLKGTASEKVRELMDRIYDYRKKEEKKLEQNPDLMLGDVTTINVSIIKGGKQGNVVPPLIEITADVRLALCEDLEEFEKMLHKWTRDSGGNITIEFPVKEVFSPPTKIDDSNIFWTAFKNATDAMNLKIKPQVFPAGTDASYIRSIGIPALGFSPMINTPVLLHDHDEYIQADMYLRGIEIYEKIIESVANAED